MTHPRIDHEPASAPILRADALLLDLDGTLIDSTEALRRSWTTWAIEQELTQQDFARVLGHGLTSSAIVAALVPPVRIAAAQARIDELEVEDVTGIVALPGAHAFVSSLPTGRWTIVTSGNRAVAGARLRVAGIPVPDTLVSADDVRNGKPDPEPYLLGAKRLGIAPERCVVVEDAPAGLTAARAAGMATIAVTTHYERAELDADLVVEDLQNVRVEVDGDALTIAVTHGA